MAMGNWDSFIIRHDNSDIIFNNYRPILYKNWIYLFYKDGAFSEFWQGKLDFIHDELKLVAIRGPQNGIYFCMWSGYEHKNNLIRISGVGCYGYNDDEWIGVLESSKDFLNTFVKKVNWDFWYNE